MPHHKSESMLYEKIPRMFSDVAWNMLQRFLLAPLSLFIRLFAHCSPVDVVVDELKIAKDGFPNV